MKGIILAYKKPRVMNKHILTAIIIGLFPILLSNCNSVNESPSHKEASASQKVETTSCYTENIQEPNQDSISNILIADAFDFPVGKPDAKSYYNAQPFTKNNHLGDDWNAVTEQ